MQTDERQGAVAAPVEGAVALLLSRRVAAAAYGAVTCNRTGEDLRTSSADTSDEAMCDTS